LRGGGTVKQIGFRCLPTPLGRKKKSPGFNVMPENKENRKKRPIVSPLGRGRRENVAQKPMEDGVSVVV